MRKAIRVIVSSILVAMLSLNSVWANELNNQSLDFQSFTVNDVSHFIEQEGIQIPEDIQRVNGYEDIIYSIMMSAYEDPQYRPEYQYTKMQELAEKLTQIVRTDCRFDIGRSSCIRIYSYLYYNKACELTIL